MREEPKYSRTDILKALLAIKGQRIPIQFTDTVIELEAASLVSIVILTNIKPDYSLREKARLDIGAPFWRVIQLIEKGGRLILDSTFFSNTLWSRYIVALLKNMPTVFVVDSNVITGLDVIKFRPNGTFSNSFSDEFEHTQNETHLRVTTIVGAGAAIGLGETEGVTTKYITEQLLQKTEAGTQELLKTIHDNIPEKYKNNFEGYFYVVEQLVTFDRDWLNNEDKFTHPLAPFIIPRKVTPNDKKKRPRYILLEMYRQLMDTINQYNEYFAKEINGKLRWYADFWRTPTELFWDVFTFNYDTTLEKCLERKYIDGYKDSGTDIQMFTPTWYLSEFKHNNKHTINHVHGCLLYSGEEPDFDADSEIQAVYSHTQRKWKSYQANKKFLEKVLMGKGLGQTGDFLAQDSIITGLQKTDKIISHPYAFYRTQLDKQLIENNRLLIVGYSFNDYYVNNMLESLPSYHESYKIVIIDYLSNSEEIDSRQSYALGEFFKEHSEKKFMQHFIETIINKGVVKKGDNVWSKFEYDTTKDQYIISSDTQVMFFYGGFKEASGHRDVIYNFLLHK